MQEIFLFVDFLSLSGATLTRKQRHLVVFNDYHMALQHHKAAVDSPSPHKRFHESMWLSLFLLSITDVPYRHCCHCLQLQNLDLMHLSIKEEFSIIFSSPAPNVDIKSPKV